MELLIKDVVRLLHVPENTVYEWIDVKKLRAMQVGGQYRISKIDLLEWATQNNITITTEFHQFISGTTQALPGLLKALESGGIHYSVSGTDKTSLLTSVVDALTLPEGTDKSLLLHVLLAREALGSTGIGEGIAIPHPRNPIVLNVEKPYLSLVFPKVPVDFDAVDKKPVIALFVLICPTVRLHLHLLSRIAFMLHNVSFKQKLLAQAPAEQILDTVRNIETTLIGEQV